MKKFLIIVFLSFIFSFNFNWVYGQNCQNDISVSSTQACVINKINQIIDKINIAKGSLKEFKHGARYYNFGESFDSTHLDSIILAFQIIYGYDIDAIKNEVRNRIEGNNAYKEPCLMGINHLVFVGWSCLAYINSLLSSYFGKRTFLNFDYPNYGVSIILEDKKSYIFLSITNEGRNIFAKEGLGYRVLKFLDKLPSFLTYLKSFRDIGSTINSFKEESACTTNLNGPNGIIQRIKGTTSLDYIRKVDKHIDAFDQSISKKHFLDTFNLVYEGGIVKAFFENDPRSGVWKDGGYYKVGVYLENIVPAADAIRNKANKFIETYNLYLDACTIKFFENGKTPRYNIDAKDLADKMEEYVRNFSPIIKSGYIKVKEVDVPIAVIPPVVWSDEHLGTKTLAAITPERVFNEVRNFVFSLAPFVFTILLLAGALFYLLSPFDIEKIKTGSEYIKWAVFGYFLLLIITSILLALRFIFGGP
jgi:hypothetical protein